MNIETFLSEIETHAKNKKGCGCLYELKDEIQLRVNGLPPVTLLPGHLVCKKILQEQHSLGVSYCPVLHSGLETWQLSVYCIKKPKEREGDNNWSEGQTDDFNLERIGKVHGYDSY